MHVFKSWSNPGVVIKNGCLYTVLLTALRLTTGTAVVDTNGMNATAAAFDTGKL